MKKYINVRNTTCYVHRKQFFLNSDSYSPSYQNTGWDCNSGLIAVKHFNKFC